MGKNLLPADIRDEYQVEERRHRSEPGEELLPQ